MKVMTLFESVTSSNPMQIPERPNLLGMPDSERDSAHNAHLNAKRKAELHNRDSFLWLYEVLTGKWGDHGQETENKRHALLTKLEQFRTAIRKTKNPSLPVDFKNYPFDSFRAEAKGWAE